MASEAGSRLWEDAERSECCEMLWSIGPETILLWICGTEHNWAQCPCEERSSRTHTAACDPACLNFAAALHVTFRLHMSFTYLYMTPESPEWHSRWHSPCVFYGVVASLGQRARSQLRRDSALRIPAQRLSFRGAAIEALRCSQKCATFQHVETRRKK